MYNKAFGCIVSLFLLISIFFRILTYLSTLVYWLIDNWSSFLTHCYTLDNISMKRAQLFNLFIPSYVFSYWQLTQDFDLLIHSHILTHWQLTSCLWHFNPISMNKSLTIDSRFFTTHSHILTHWQLIPCLLLINPISVLDSFTTDPVLIHSRLFAQWKLLLRL